MGEQIISLSWAELDALTGFLENSLTAQGLPTVLRLRTQMVVEEIFFSVLASPGADSAKLRCTLPAPRTVKLQCRSAHPGFAPDWTDLKGLIENGSTYGLKLTEHPDGWTILVGEK